MCRVMCRVTSKIICKVIGRLQVWIQDCLIYGDWDRVTDWDKVTVG